MIQGTEIAIEFPMASIVLPQISMENETNRIDPILFDSN